MFAASLIPTAHAEWTPMTDVLAWGTSLPAKVLTAINDVTGVTQVAADRFVGLLLAGGNTLWFGPPDGSGNYAGAGLQNVKSIAMGFSHMAGLSPSGTVQAMWLGGPSPDQGAIQVPAALTNVAALSAGGNFTLALKADGTVVAWGQVADGWQTITNAIAVSAGKGGNGVVLKADGTVASFDFQRYKTPAGLSGVKAVSAGRSHYLALKDDGTVVSWGGWLYVPPGLTGVKAISAGDYRNLALKWDGTVVCWKPSGSIYDSSQYEVVPSDAVGVTSIAAGYDVQIVRRGGSASVVWGGRLSGIEAPPLNTLGAYEAAVSDNVGAVLIADGSVVTWGKGALPSPSSLNSPIAITAGSGSTIALNSDGRPIGWGLNLVGNTVAPGAAVGMKAVAAGGTFSVGLKSDGTLLAWGILPAPALTNVKAVAAGSSHGLALLADGTVAAWGSNSRGQTSVPAGLNNVIAIAAGYEHSLALKADGTVVTWGGGLVGGYLSVPAGLGNVVAISAGVNFSSAQKSDGTVVSWGLDNLGETMVPATLSGVTVLASGGRNSIAVTRMPLVTDWTVNSSPPGMTFTTSGGYCQEGTFTTPRVLQGLAGFPCTISFALSSTSSTTQTVFAGWADGAATGPTRDVEVQPASSFTASFKTQHQLTVLANPAGTGTAIASGFFDANSNVPVVATPLIGYRFNGWTGAVASPNLASTTVFMDGPKTVTANFTSGAVKSFSIDFLGSSTALSPGEIAGVVEKPNWNSATGAQSTSPLALRDESGALTTATVSWTAANTWSVPITGTTGQIRMMRGYLDNATQRPTTVTVTGLPVAANGWDIYVYTDGDNGSARKEGLYWLDGGAPVFCSDRSNFTGTYQRCADGPGNYVVLSTAETSFKLTALPIASESGNFRAPVNGIQIVPRDANAAPPAAVPVRIPGKAIGIKFTGKGLPLGSSETAGVVARKFWNNAAGPVQSDPLALRDENGAFTGATVTWKATNDWQLPIADTAGNMRLMRGYLDNVDTQPVTVTISGLDPSPTGYDVYVYTDGDNPNIERRASYSINGNATLCMDLGTAQFNGVFTRCTGGAGNYVRYESLPVAGANPTTFTITATPVSGGRSPVNAIQIVPR